MYLGDENPPGACAGKGVEHRSERTAVKCAYGEPPVRVPRSKCEPFMQGPTLVQSDRAITSDAPVVSNADRYALARHRALGVIGGFGMLGSIWIINCVILSLPAPASEKVAAIAAFGLLFLVSMLIHMVYHPALLARVNSCLISDDSGITIVTGEREAAVRWEEIVAVREYTSYRGKFQGLRVYTVNGASLYICLTGHGLEARSVFRQSIHNRANLHRDPSPVRLGGYSLYARSDPSSRLLLSQAETDSLVLQTGTSEVEKGRRYL